MLATPSQLAPHGFSNELLTWLTIISLISHAIIWIREYQKSKVNLNIQCNFYYMDSDGTLYLFLMIGNNSHRPITINAVEININDNWYRCEQIQHTVRLPHREPFATAEFPAIISALSGVSLKVAYKGLKQSISREVLPRLDVSIDTNHRVVYSSIELGHIWPRQRWRQT